MTEADMGRLADKAKRELKESQEKSFEKLSFHDMVDVVAGSALQKLIRGENWRSIIFCVAMEVSSWQQAQQKK